MTAEYELTYAHYKQAQRLYLKYRPSSLFWYVAFLWALPACSAIFAVYWSVIWLEGRRHQANALSGFLFLAAYLALVFPLLRWWRLRRGYSQLFPKDSPRIARITFDEEAVHGVIPGRSEGKFFWPGILEFAEDEHVAILFVRKKLFMMVPHSAFTPMQWSELRALIGRKLAENAAAAGTA